jgi:hypothetical protein
MKKMKPQNSRTKLALRIFALLAALYLLLFAGFFTYQMTHNNDWYGGYFEELAMRNYISMPRDSADSALPEQKLKKTASIAARSKAYDADQAAARKAITAQKAVVQMERSTGLPGNRRLELAVGVQPGAFDTLKAALLALGHTVDSSETLTDMTLDYQKLLAEQESLAQRLKRYEALRTQAKDLQSQLQLEDKVIAAESELQQKRIELNDFSTENALCTIQFNLSENGRVDVLSALGKSATYAGTVLAAVTGVFLLMFLTSTVPMMLWSYLKKQGQKPEDKENG